MKIAIIGGGPAGLYFALLMKKQEPRHAISVYEQNGADATYGWGVVFSDVALSFLRDANEEFFHEFTAGHTRCDYMQVVHKGVSVQLHNNHFSRAARIDLLKVLHQACLRAGVEIHFNTRIGNATAVAADLVVAADGANSAVRTQFAEHFRPSIEARRNKFAWYGTRQLFHPVSLVFRETEHGIFIAHSYQYSKELSTFLVEVDPETWKRARLDRMSEDESCRYCADVFRPELGSNELLSNRSLWFQANIIRNEAWTYKNIVLLGDALRTVHFSLGSGTRMAMQDAIALFRAFQKSGDNVAAALTDFESARRGKSEDFQEAAARSLDWYENVAAKMSLDPISFAYDYMRRTGRVSHEDLKQRDPYFVSAYDALHKQSA